MRIMKSDKGGLLCTYMHDYVQEGTITPVFKIQIIINKRFTETRSCAVHWWISWRCWHSKKFIQTVTGNIIIPKASKGTVWNTYSLWVFLFPSPLIPTNSFPASAKFSKHWILCFDVEHTECSSCQFPEQCEPSFSPLRHPNLEPAAFLYHSTPISHKDHPNKTAAYHHLLRTNWHWATHSIRK